MQDTNTYKDALQKREWLSGLNVFIFLWVLLFVLYYPAAKAGFVADFSGWLDSVKNDSFIDYINRKHCNIHSLYQVTQFNTYIFYKLFGTSVWLWHLLFVTLQTINACLMYALVANLLRDVQVDNGKIISFGGAILFCVSPYISEVVVWAPSFHYLQGLLVILLILLWVQRYTYTTSKKYIWWAEIVYLLSTYTLELFYITPWLVLMLGLFYRFNPGFDKRIFRRILFYFFIPQILLFLAHLAVYKRVYGTWVAHISTGSVTSLGIADFGKPARYLFHLVFMGRFFSDPVKKQVYDFCNSTGCVCVFWGIVLIMFINIAVRFRHMDGRSKVGSLLFVWLIISLSLLIPVGFYDTMLVICDRYVYCASLFFYLLVAISLGRIPFRYIRMGVFGLFMLLNLRFAIKVNRYWGKSAKVIFGLLHNLPVDDDKTIILLNLPQNMHGVQMIGAAKESEYKSLHDLLLPDKFIKQTLYDAAGYNMLTPDDGAHVTVLNDSMVRVTLNQWGTWWWYNNLGGISYSNKDYKLNMVDAGHFYELTLKKPASQYLLLYEVGDKWKVVDMGKKYDQY